MNPAEKVRLRKKQTMLSDRCVHVNRTTDMHHYENNRSYK